MRLCPEQADIDDFRNNNTEYMGSGYSKIYAMLLDDFPIYDSRTVCGLTSLIRLYCKETNQKVNDKPGVPDLLKLGVPQDQSSQDRNPGDGPYKFPGLYHSWKPSYAISYVKAAWLLKKLVNQPDSCFSDVPKHRQVLALQSALFMIGYKPLEDDAICKGS